MSVHVAIDAFRLTGPATSIGTYTLELAASLADEKCDLTFLLPRRERGGLLAHAQQTHPCARFVTAKTPLFPEQGIGKLAHWNQIVIPSLLKESGATCLISTYHQTPLRVPPGIARVSIIHDCCGLREDCGYRPYRRAWLMHWTNLKTAALAADAILPISQATHDAYLEAFPSASNRLTAPLYNRVSTATLDVTKALHLLQELSLLPNSYVLGFGLAGRRKGTDVALQAYSLYRKQGGRLPLVLIAGRNLDLEQWGLDGTLRNEVMLLDRVDDQTRDALYSGASSFLFCSRCEGFGYPLVEAARQGCPPVAWKQTTAYEIFRDAIPLVNHLTPGEVSKLLHRYERLEQADRDALKLRLIQCSDAFDGAHTGANLMTIIRSAIARTTR